MRRYVVFACRMSAGVVFFLIAHRLSTVVEGEHIVV